MEDLKKAFGYADDVAILEVFLSLEMNSSQIQKAINTALAHGRESVTLNSKRLELMHFSRRHRDKGNSPH